LNTPLLIGSAVVLIVAGGSAFAVHQYFANQIAATFLQRAATLEREQNWIAASAYLGRYLQLEPADLDARLRLLAAVENSSTTPRGRNRLISLLYQMVGSLPERTDLRVKLVDQLMETGNYDAAEKAAREVLDQGDVSQQRHARRAIALSHRAMAREDGVVTLATAAKSLATALADDPGDAVLASLTASLYRDAPDQVGPEATPSQADTIMNRLVEAKPKDVDALLARYGYRRRYGLDDAQADLDAAVALDDQRTDVLLLAADADMNSGDANRLKKVAERLQDAIELEPQSPLGYIALGRLYVANRNQDEAIKTLLDGRSKIGEPNLDLEYLLAQSLIESNRISEAKKVVGEFSEQVGKLLAESGGRAPTATRIKLENMNRLLAAKLAYANKDLPTVVREAEAIIITGDKSGEVAGNVELLEAYALLATAASQSNRPELAAFNWAALSARSPAYRDAALKAGVAYMLLGETENALAQLNRYVKLPNSSPEALIPLAQASLQQQLRRPAAMRDWTDYLQTIDTAKSQLADRWEWKAAQAIYFASQGTEQGRADALQQLRDIESSHAKEPVVIERLVVLYRQLGQPADAQRLLDDYRHMAGRESRSALLQAGMLAGNKQPDEANKVLQHAISQASPPERRELQVAQVRLMLASGKMEQAQSIAADLIAEYPTDAQLLAMGLEIALLRQEFEVAEKWELQLEKAATIDDFDLKYFRSRRLLAQFAKLDQQQQDRLEQLVESVRSQRPDWAPVITLGAHYADVRGDRRAAIEAYREAIAAGDRRAETLQLLVRALYAERRFNEANEVLSQFGNSEAAQGQIATLAIAAAVQDNQLSEAQSLAQQAVDRSSQDPLHYLLLANLQFNSGDQPAAEEVFRSALKRFPRDPRVWNGVFMFFVESKQPDKARVALDRWTEHVPLEDAQKQLVLGEGKEVLGDQAEAEQHYRQSISLDGRNAQAHFRLAKLLMATDVAAAREELDQVLRIDPTHAEARQLLAAVLAASGNDADWTQAVQLLERGSLAGGDAANSASDRLHAILLARKGKNKAERLENYQAAVELLLQRLQESGSTGPEFDVDRMLLAGVYEQQARMTADSSRIVAARDVLRPLIDRPTPALEHLLYYIQLLMRQIAESPAAASDSEADSSREVFVADVRDRIRKLEQSVATDQAEDRRSLPIALEVKLLSLEGKSEQGKTRIEVFAEEELAGTDDDSERAKVFLRVGGLFQSAGFDTDAEHWFRRLVEIAPSGYVLVAQSMLRQGKPDEAIDFCIEAGSKMPPAAVATVLAQILSSSSADAALDRKAQPLIAAALDADRGNVDLLMSVAVERVTRDDLKEAARLFKRVIQLQPRHTLALNNLATLYAEQPEHLSEAREYVERAMAVAGRNPALLDTLGTIQLRAGRFDEAVAALEESVAGSASDPRYYFHLAAAYDGADESDKARKALSTAMELGLDKAILTEGDRQLLATLRRDLLAANRQTDR
jgi:tetratricopeptide (TPR) repeat protein